MARKREADSGTEPSLQALTSPVRIEMIGAVKAAGSCSIRELAARMGRPADGLYHHVRLLLEAGVLAEVGSRKVGRRTEAVYGLASDRVVGAVDPASPPSRQAVVKAASAALRLAAREFASAVESGEAICEGDVPAVFAQRQTTWLTAAEVAELREMLGRVERFLAERADRREGRPCSFTTVLVPLARRGHPRDGP